MLRCRPRTKLVACFHWVHSLLPLSCWPLLTHVLGVCGLQDTCQTFHSPSTWCLNFTGKWVQTHSSSRKTITLAAQCHQPFHREIQTTQPQLQKGSLCSLLFFSPLIPPCWLAGFPYPNSGGHHDVTQDGGVGNRGQWVDLNPAIQNRTYKISALGLLCAQNLTHKDFLFLYCMKILFCYLVSTWKVENLLDKLWFCKMSLDVVWEVPWGVRLGFYKHWQCTTVTVQCQLCLYSLFSCSWFKSIIFLYFCSRSGGLTKLLGVNYYLPLG